MWLHGQELLQKQPEEFGEVDKRIKPVKAFLCPWHGTGLYQSVALQLLDIALHINTSLRFILEGKGLVGKRPVKERKEQITPPASG